MIMTLPWRGRLPRTTEISACIHRFSYIKDAFRGGDAEYIAARRNIYRMDVFIDIDWQCGFRNQSS